MTKKYLPYLIFLSLLIGSGKALPQSSPFYNVKVSKYLMGTVVETDVQGPDVETCQKALLLAYQEMSRVENLLSFQISSSEINRVNRAAGVQPVKVSEETFQILERARAYSEKLDGLFDVTIGALTDRWGFSDNDNKKITIPSDSELAVLIEFP
ncbi:MAG: FAD:protein FMN transferase [Calditrichota bacterium]